MVNGLDLFNTRFIEFRDSLILIGGAACHEWFASQDMEFRSTKDLDIVIVAEEMSEAFVTEMRLFIQDGQYEIKTRSESGTPVLYRFAKPENAEFPFMLEIFSRHPDVNTLFVGQEIAPIPHNEDGHSLSAIMLNDDYYQLVRSYSVEPEGRIPYAAATALIPLKASAHLDLAERKRRGDTVKSTDILKHRNDVFRLAATLPATSGDMLPETIRDNLKAFLDKFPASSDDWFAIRAAIKNTVGGGVTPDELIGAIRTYFSLVDNENVAEGRNG